MAIRIFILICLLCIGCQYNPHAHLYTTKEPLVKDIVGSYVLKSETIFNADLSDLHRRQCKLDLYSDGTFNAINLPPKVNFQQPDKNFFETLISGKGTWSIRTIGSVDDGSEIKRVWGIILDSPSVQFENLNLTGNDFPYGLIISLGDGDMGEALIFKLSK